MATPPAPSWRWASSPSAPAPACHLPRGWGRRWSSGRPPPPCRAAPATRRGCSTATAAAPTYAVPAAGVITSFSHTGQRHCRVHPRGGRGAGRPARRPGGPGLQPAGGGHAQHPQHLLGADPSAGRRGPRPLHQRGLDGLPGQHGRRRGRGGRLRSRDPSVSSTFTPAGPPAASRRLNLSAVWEPDVDKDLYGDVSQDLCPQSAQTQAACPAPDTTITKAPAKRSSKRQAKIKFTSVPGATFTCAVDGKAAKPCASPFKKRYRYDKHKVVVTAISSVGIPDPTPAVGEVQDQAAPLTSALIERERILPPISARQRDCARACHPPRLHRRRRGVRLGRRPADCGSPPAPGPPARTVRPARPARPASPPAPPGPRPRSRWVRPAASRRSALPRPRCPAATLLAAEGAGAPTYVAPTNGVLVSFTHKAGNSFSQVRAIVFANSTPRQPQGGRGEERPAERADAPRQHLPDPAPDQGRPAPGPGLHLQADRCLNQGVAGDASAFASPFNPDTTNDFYTSGTFTGGSYRPNISAVLEPDEDGDAFGDITQDACPQSALSQVACPAPDTVLTTKLKRHRGTSRIKLKFVSTIAGSTFECARDGHKFKRVPRRRTRGDFARGKHKLLSPRGQRRRHHRTPRRSR